MSFRTSTEMAQILHEGLCWAARIELCLIVPVSHKDLCTCRTKGVRNDQSPSNEDRACQQKHTLLIWTEITKCIN